MIDKPDIQTLTAPRPGLRVADVNAILGEQSPGKRLSRKWWMIGVTALIVVAFVVFRLSGGGSPAPTWQTAAVTRGDLSVTVTATGALAPLDTVDVGTEVSGTIDVVAADYNDRVRKGQILARINTDEIEAQIRQRQSALRAAEAAALQTAASLEEAIAATARSESLYLTAAVSAQDVESSRAALKRAQGADAAARAQATAAEASLQLEVTSLNKATIRAPIDGIVLRRNVERGRTVTASFQTPVLFVLAADLRQMTLSLDVDEADVGQVRAGQPAQFTVDAYPDRTYHGTVKTVHSASKTVDNVVTYEAVLAVPNADLSLRPGMTATALITTSVAHDVVLVPNAALRVVMPSAQEPATIPPGSARIWTLRNGQPAPLVIKTGVTDGTSTEVIGGDLAAGTQIIVMATTPATEARRGFTLFGRPPHP